MTDATQPEEPTLSADDPVLTPSETVPSEAADAAKKESDSPKKKEPVGIRESFRQALEAPETGVATARASLRDLLIVTWGVPAAALRHHVPESLALDRLPDENGDLLAFVQVRYALRLDARWAALPKGSGDAYFAADVRALVRGDGRPGAFLLQAFVGNQAMTNLLYPLARRVEESRFDIFVGGNPATGRCDSMRVGVSTDSLQLSLAAEAVDGFPETPFGPWDGLTSFFTQRESVWHEARFPRGGLTLMPQSHEPLKPQPLRLTAAIAAPLTALGFAESLERPAIVQYQHAVNVAHFPPRPWKDPTAQK